MKNTYKTLLAGAMAAIMILSMTACATVTEITDNESNDVASTFDNPIGVSSATIGIECTREEFIEYMPDDVYVPEIPEGYTATYNKKESGIGNIEIGYGQSYFFTLSIQPCKIQYPVLFTNEAVKESTFTDPNTGESSTIGNYYCVWERSNAVYKLNSVFMNMTSESKDEFITLARKLCSDFSEGDTGIQCTREDFMIYMPENVYIPEIPEGYTAEYIYNNQTKNGYIYIEYGQTYDFGVLITPCENENPKTEPYEEIDHNVQSDRTIEDTPVAVIIGKWENSHASYLQIGKFVVKDGKDDDDYIAIFRNLVQQFASNN